MIRVYLSVVAAIVLLAGVQPAMAAAAQDVPETQPTAAPAAEVRLTETEALLVAGRLADAGSRLKSLMDANPKDDQARFEAGVVRFLTGVEQLGQALHRYSPRTPGMMMLGLPGTRLPIPSNPNPQKISYADFRAVLESWSQSLTETAELLSGLGDSDVKLTLRFGLVRLDFDGDGRGSEEEALWRIYAALNPGAGLDESVVQGFFISFDRADAEWLRGYCHLLMAINEFFLAHDFRELFERTAHLFFPLVDSPHTFLAGPQRRQDFEFSSIVDMIAYVHLLNFPVEEPARMTRALEHLRSMIAASRRMWKFALAETDDDYEWIPNPRQTGVIPNVRVTTEQVEAWHEFLDEAEALLAGRKLVPFWRDAGGRGVNLMRIFTEPRPFDLVLWVQGTAATPYLEEGTTTSGEIWGRLQRTFGGEFLGFALWWN